MFVGTFGAINQNKIKRLFAYSSIAHVGYMLIGLATGTIEAVESLLVYIIIYILMIINVFGILLIMAKEDFTVQKPTPITGNMSTYKIEGNDTNEAYPQRFGYSTQNH
jgi:NADH-quinone oxidoreductase subunit N